MIFGVSKFFQPWIKGLVFVDFAFHQLQELHQSNIIFANIFLRSKYKRTFLFLSLILQRGTEGGPTTKIKYIITKKKKFGPRGPKPPPGSVTPCLQTIPCVIIFSRGLFFRRNCIKQSVYARVQLSLLLFPFPNYFLPSFLFFHLSCNQIEYQFSNLATTLNKKINITTYFKNLTIRVYVLYVLNTHVKFRANQMLFTIQPVNLFFMHNFLLQKLRI